MRISDDETIREYEKEDQLDKVPVADYNAPDPSMKMNTYLWLGYYLKDPRPNGFESDQFTPFGFSQILISSLDVLLS